MAENDLTLSVSIEAQIAAFERDLKRAGRLVETSAGGMDKSTRRAAQAFDRLEGKLDPVSRKLRRLERDYVTVRAAVDSNAISQQRAGAVLERLNQQLLRTEHATDAYARGMMRARTSSFNMGSAVQQAGFQVGDFAVQVASGQGVLRPLIQQGTQLVSMFGPMGAVVGAAGAILGALATTMFDLGDKTEKVNEKQRTYQELIRLSDELTGDAARTARELADARLKEARATRITAIETARLAEEQLKLAIAELETRPQGRAGEAGFRNRLERAAELRDLLGQVQAKAKELALDLAELDQGVGEFDVSGSGRNGGKGGLKLPDPNDVSVRSRRNAASLGRTAGDEFIILRNRKLAEEEESRLKRIGDTVESLRTPYDDYNDRMARLNEALEAGRIRWDQYEMASDAAQQALNDAMRTTDIMADAVEGFGRSVENTFDRAIRSGMEWRDVLRSVLADALRSINSFVQQTMSASNSSGGFLGSLVSAAFGALMGPSFSTGNIGGLSGTPYITNQYGTFTGLAGRAHGGPVDAGTDYIVGEKGPEILRMGAKPGMIIPNKQIGGDSITVVNNIDARGSNMTESQFEAILNRKRPGIIEDAKQAVRSAIRSTPSFLEA